MEAPILAAQADIVRARERVEVELARGLALGAKGGLTADHAEAEAVLNVCRWRLKMLEKERSELRAPPESRWGLALQSTGQRAILLGGWDQWAVASRHDSTFILDLEQEMERRRRLEDEFQARLGRYRLSLYRCSWA